MKFFMIIDTKRRAEGKLEKGDNENEKKQENNKQGEKIYSSTHTNCNRQKR